LRLRSGWRTGGGARLRAGRLVPAAGLRFGFDFSLRVAGLHRLNGIASKIRTALMKNCPGTAGS
jgi:hypothetical protein